MSGAIYGFAQSADRAARFADPHIAQLICRSRSAICGYTHCTTNRADRAAIAKLCKHRSMS